MASLQQKGDSWYCQFLYHGKRHTFTVGKVADAEAEAKASQVDYLLMRLKQNLLQLPPGMDIVAFIEFDGKPPHETAARDCLTLGALRDRYLETHQNGSLEQSTLDGIESHFRHLIGTLGDDSPYKTCRWPTSSSTWIAGQDEGAERKTLPGDDPQGNRHPQDGLELGRADGALNR